jgi:hypothetical protein
MSKQKGKRKCKKSKAEQDYVRSALQEAVKEGGKSQREIADAIGRNQSNVSKFLAAKTRLDDEAIEALYAFGLVKRPSPRDLEEKPSKPAKVVHAPLEAWTGKVKSVKQVSGEKGYSPATIRKWCKIGKLNYIMDGRRIMVVIDRLYRAIPLSEKAQLRERIATLEAENDALREKVHSLQMEFAWDTEEETEAAPVELVDDPDAGETKDGPISEYFQVVTVDNAPVAGWKMKPEVGADGRWPAMRVNGTNATANLNLPDEVLFRIQTNYARETVTIPTELAMELIAEVENT